MDDGEENVVREVLPDKAACPGAIDSGRIRAPASRALPPYPMMKLFELRERGDPRQALDKRW